MLKTNGGRGLLKVLLLALIVTAWAFVSVGYASATEWHVYPGQSIQTAINNAGIGDTIYVHDGTYFENVNVNKRLTIQSENGPENCIVQAANTEDYVFEVAADYVNISGFTVRGARWAGNAGIYLGNGVDHGIISNNYITKNSRGISLYYSNENTIISNNINNNSWHCIELKYSDYNVISDNEVSHNLDLLLWGASFNTLTNNKVAHNSGGIELVGSDDNIIANCEVTDNGITGIDLSSSDRNNITDNNVSYHKLGILISFSDFNALTGNNVSFNTEYGGLELSHSGSNTLRNNCLIGNKYSFGVSSYDFANFYNDIDTSNYVDGKPIYYLVGASDLLIDSSSNAATVYCINCNNVTIRDLNFTNNMEGILLYNTKHSKVENNHITDNSDNGVHIYKSTNNTVSSNLITRNSDNGISFKYSSNNTIIDNNITKHYCGVEILFSSNDNIISFNNVTNNDVFGICIISSSSDNTILGNLVANNDDFGISIYYSCNSNTVKANNISNNTNGISIYSSTGNIVERNNIIKNRDQGIYLYENSNDNSIYLNNFINNSRNANSENSTNLWHSTDLISYRYNKSGHTNYLGNYWDDYNGSDSDSDGLGDTSHVISDDNSDDYPLIPLWEKYFTENQPPVASFSYLPVNPAVNETVTFNASASYDPDGSIASYNWSFGDGNGTNATESTITHSYTSVGEYTVNLTVTDDEGAPNKTSRVIKVFPDITYFDTEPGTYPSICGIHNGTIMMTHTVNVSTIFIYPCPGTGGHIEYARIWNSSWDGAEAHWHGYADNWHNCSFDKNFTLVAGAKYNYTIRTGSYPQIHHTSELLTAKGWIRCTEFEDANGKRYCTWIPAILLY